ncbi:MAG: transposase [Acetobacteraceae bacterium]|nr:transposase [Acetobacteraceae bacterium]MBV8522024.1 transposase [Acetobacteraceae bacterium]
MEDAADLPVHGGGIEVATVGYSRRIYVRAFRHERQSAWLDGMEGAFCHFGGVTEETVFDNARGWLITTIAALRSIPIDTGYPGA